MPNDATTFDPDAFHQQYTGSSGGFDPDAFHGQYASPAVTSSSSAPSEPSTMQKVGSYAGDIATGVGKGLLSTGTALSPLIHKIPLVGETLAPEQGIEAAQKMAVPTNTPQKIGKYGEQAAEFLAPGLGEEDAGLAAAKIAPKLGKYAAPAGRIAYNALTSGAINKMQGGSFKQGAALGGGSSIIGEGAKAVAPSIAESALGITRKMRGYGRTPGKAILENTTAWYPGTIAEQAESKLANLTSELESRASSAATPVSLSPALGVINTAKTKAISRNSQATYDLLGKVEDQLTKNFQTGAAIPRDVPARTALDLKRGIGELEGTWPIEAKKGIHSTIRKVYSALDKETDAAAPGTAEINDKISSLIPGAQRAHSEDLGAGISQRALHRVAAHTGAATLGLGGGFEGYREGGVPGAAAGLVGGIVLPEILASPTSQMGVSRIFNSPMSSRIGRAAVGPLLNKSRDEENPKRK